MQAVLNSSEQIVRYDRSHTKEWLFGLLIVEIITVLTPVGVLSSSFRFPDILREPAAAALPLFSANQSIIVPAYYVFMLSGLLYLPISVLIRKQFTGTATRSLLDLLVGLGIATALFQAIGFCRWLFAVPYLAKTYEQAAGNAPLRASVALLYDTLNRYAGMTIGEHLGFVAMGSWTICLALVLSKTGAPQWLRGGGILIGALIILSVAEHFGTAWSGFFGLVNFIANALWTVWLLVLAVRIIR
ncbi:DUF4386 domain-containing protein [Fibrisoma montanum]|uniref:DUF4386 domain-containing protein n=1 Tax=Fibrisoma montanum TaxID=2305895 RepID=A0A418LX15_9BACT|nr:DUF4386 domain-containing protein [Fibrisoma montanum]RIV17790.1 DUF4386 domain-containing protein [Fibrisoma montanum]